MSVVKFLTTSSFKLSRVTGRPRDILCFYSFPGSKNTHSEKFPLHFDWFD